jgi:Immunity protein 44
MKFWTSGRIDEKIDFECFQPIMLEVESRINELLKESEYGDEIVSYDVVVNIFEQQSDGEFKYSIKSKETDIDVNVNHNEFINADYNERCTLFFNAILHSIDKIRGHRKLAAFNFDLFYQDVSALLKKYT